MLIEIKKDIFEGENFEGLRYVTQIIFWKGRYELYVELPLVLNFELYKRLNDVDKSIIEQQFNKLVIESRRADLSISEIEKDGFSLEEAIAFLEQPVIVILENSLNDGHFLRAIIKHFDATGVVTKHLENRWLEFGNAGGKTNFFNFITAKLKRFRKLPKPNYSYLKVFVLLDSDKKFPKENKESYKRLMQLLEENNIPFHILEKREMENYMPDEVIDSILEQREFIDAYLRLSPIQKDYFDLEKGFPDRNIERLPDDDGFKQLYEEIGGGDIGIFRKNSFNQPFENFKSEFPKLFHHQLVTKATLLKRCEHHSNNPEEHPYNPKELPDLLKKIAELL